ncbi:MAG: PD40 domain-containing protein, partial [Blastocatellia bacterium]|nr:PD40 domain-containing protein [Blastocatellia bacterium]
DALITQLGRAGEIQVRATSSILKFNVLEQDAVAVGRELHVDAVLQGNFQRLENKLRLTVQMLRSRNGNSIWADSFNAEIEDIFEVQDRIAERVVGALREKLSDEARAKLTKRDTENVEAYQQYLEGRFFYSKRSTDGYDAALKCFQKAIDIDPAYALAHAGLADIFNLLPVYDGFAPREYFPKAKAAALKALVIDGNLAEAHSALGLAILHYDWNWEGAEVSFRNAVRLGPNYAAAYQLLGVYFLRGDRIGDALIALQKARELDPFSPINAVWLAEVLRHYGETDASIQLHLETLGTFPDFFLAHYHLAFSYMDAGRLDEAELHRERAVALSNENSLTLSLQGILQAAMGTTSAAQQTLEKLLRMKKEKYISSANIASVYAALKNEAKAIEWLETGLTERDPNLTWIKFDAEFRFLKPNPRFQAILQEVGLAEGKSHLLEEKSPRRPRWQPLAAFGILSLVIISALVFYLQRGGNVPSQLTPELRLTSDPKQDNRPYWTNDGRIRFFRSGNDRQIESWIMNADGSNQTVVRDFENFDHGIWSPDGTKVIFWKRGDKTTFYLADADGSDEIPLPFLPGNLDWSPDGRRIAYQKNVKVGDPDLFVYSLETAASVNVTNDPGFDADPNFSPDGTQIAFASLRDGNAEIYLMNADGGNVRRLTNHPAWDNHPVFSPDGTAIAFNSDREDENSDVYLINPDGSGIRHLTDSTDNESVEPGCWSPDGTRITFYSDRFDNDDIFVASAEVVRPRILVSDDAANLQFPMFSPDGKRIAYQSDLLDKSGELRLFDIEKNETRVLLKMANADIAPVFSPDGQWIAFQNKIESNTEIYRIRTDGKDLSNLSQNAGRDVYPMFSPDGEQIAFASNRDDNYGGYNLYVMDANGGSQRLIYSDKLGMSVEPAWSPDGR